MGRSLGAILIGDYKAQLRPLEITTKALQNTNVVDLFEEMERRSTKASPSATSQLNQASEDQSTNRSTTDYNTKRRQIPPHSQNTHNQLTDPPKLAQVHQLHHNHELHFTITHIRSACNNCTTLSRTCIHPAHTLEAVGACHQQISTAVVHQTTRGSSARIMACSQGAQSYIPRLPSSTYSANSAAA